MWILPTKKAEAIYDEWFTRLETGASFAEVADWLNAKGVPTGRFCRSKKWTVSLAPSASARSGGRTRTSFRTIDFESIAYAEFRHPGIAYLANSDE